MAHIIGGERKAAREDPTIEGTPAHLAAFVRGVCVKSGRDGVRLFRAVAGFKVPNDGAWTINGLFYPPGHELDLKVGDVLAYSEVMQNPDDDRPMPAVPLREVTPRVAGRLPSSDRVTGAVLVPRPDAKEIVVIDGQTVELTPAIARVLRERQAARQRGGKP